MQKATFDNEFEAFASRSSFNKNLNHFKVVNAVVAEFEGGRNMADSLLEGLTDGSVVPTQILPTLNALLLEKYGYQTYSFNLKTSTDDLSKLGEEIGKWKAVDLVLTYFHPESGVMVVNPKNPQHWAQVGSLKRFEPVTIFAGGFGKTAALLETKPFKAAVAAALEKLPGLLDSQKVKVPASLYEGNFAFKAPKKEKPAAPAKAPAAKKGKAAAAGTAVDTSGFTVAKVDPKTPAAAAPAPQPLVRAVAAVGGQTRVSNKVPVVVTNELFHNGNVEAWKKIIESYCYKYAGAKVTVFYDGELIHDINSLFKWGKVKHGTPILFSVSSTSDIMDLSKLRKYLFEGASSRYERFLHGAPGKVLELF